MVTRHLGGVAFASYQATRPCSALFCANAAPHSLCVLLRSRLRLLFDVLHGCTHLSLPCACCRA